MKFLDLLKSIFEKKQSNTKELTHIKNLESVILARIAEQKDSTIIYSQKPIMKKQLFRLTPLMVALLLFLLISGITAVTAKDTIIPQLQKHLDDIEKKYLEEDKKIREKGTLEDTPYGKLYDEKTQEELEIARKKANKEMDALIARPEHERKSAIAAVKKFMGNNNLDVQYGATSRATDNSWVNVEVYTTTTDFFEVDFRRNKVVNYGPKAGTGKEKPKQMDTTVRFTPEELEKKAREIAKRETGQDLDKLTFEPGEKGEFNYFFRWTDKTKNITIGMDGETKNLLYQHPFIQVGISRAGELVSYTNTFGLEK